MQFFGCLTPLVVTQRRNATRFVHLGPKSLNLMAHEFGSLDDLAALINTEEMPVVALGGAVDGGTELEALLAEHYVRAPLWARICFDRRLSEVWMRKAP